MFFSSGDTGSQCPAVIGVNGVPAGIPGANYPASSPYGIGVGGTSVLSPSGPTEIAWYAGGGGSSCFEPTPAFQSSTTSAAWLPLVRRGVPDVALDADPESGYQVIVSGTEEVIGGTSASAPSWQGIWARAQGAHSGALGFAGPVIYNTEPASAFHDITLGGNGFPGPARLGLHDRPGDARTSPRSSTAPSRGPGVRAVSAARGALPAGGTKSAGRVAFRMTSSGARAEPLRRPGAANQADAPGSKGR